MHSRMRYWGCVLASLVGVATCLPVAAATRFIHGVASGDPAPDSVVLWTRATPDSDGPVTVGWAISTSPSFDTQLVTGTVTTDAARDYLAPLIQGEDYPEYKNGLPQYARLKKVLEKKKLKTWRS